MMTEMVMSKTTSQKRINPRTGKPYYYKDNPEAVKARNARRMWVNGKEVSKRSFISRTPNHYQK